MSRTTGFSLVVALAVSGAPLEVSADQDGNKGAREFRLVTGRIDAAKLEHARLIRTVYALGERSSSFTLGLSGGARALGLTEFNEELQRNGYSPVGTRPTIGLSSAFYGRRAFIGLVAEGGPDSVRNVDGAKTNVGFFDLMFQGGPVFSIQEAAVAYPYVGLGFGQVTVSAQIADPSSTPILRDRIPSLPKGFDVNSLLGMLELGVGSFVSLPFSTSNGNRNGLAVGAEVGYAFSFAETDWRDSKAGPSPPSYPGPSSAAYGPTVRFLVRYVYDQFDFRAEDEPMTWCRGPGCEVVCERGFSDCDADPRNGCETELGTMENCGGCGDACTVRHGIGVCSAAERLAHDVVRPPHGDHTILTQGCALVACEPGFMNCNGWLSDGCETATLVDPYSCGGCGNLCTPLDRCVSGRCIPKSESDGPR